MEIEERKYFDPYIDIEYRNLGVTKKDSKAHKLRRVYKRNIVFSIIYTIITFGIYGWFWQFEIAKESNALSRNDKCFTPALVVFFSIITLGIYGVYWSYQVGKKHNEYYLKYKNEDKSFDVVYLILHLINYVFPILRLICYAIMQSKINSMIYIEDNRNPSGLYVKDSSIFNRPFISTILLILICQIIPDQILSVYQNLFIGAPGNPANPITGDVTQAMIKNSADQIIYADSLFMIVNDVLQILLIIGVLWWFKLRFKHSNYSGVLVFRNFGRACLLMLPGLFFIGINAFGLNIENFKFGIVLLGFVPAFVEEITFRGMIIPNIMRIFNRSKGIWLSLFLSAGIFGAIHSMNIIAGANVGTTIFQVFYAFAMGMLFGAVLIRTGNLWTCIICHGTIDSLAMMADEALSQGAVQTQAFEFSFDIIPLVVISLIFVGIGIFMCRKKKHEQITELWANKWGDALC